MRPRFKSVLPWILILLIAAWWVYDHRRIDGYFRCARESPTISLDDAIEFSKDLQGDRLAQTLQNQGRAGAVRHRDGQDCTAKPR